MKKISLIVLVCLMTVLLTGCGLRDKIKKMMVEESSNTEEKATKKEEIKEEKVVCKQKQDQVDITFIVTFKTTQMTAIDLTYDMDLSQYNDEQINKLKDTDFCTPVQNAMGKYKDAFENCVTNIENKNLHLSADFSVDKLSEQALNTMSTPKKAKEDLETQGYTCTIE